MRLYLAAPSDLAAERESVLRVVETINDELIVEDERRLEVVDWDPIAAPLVKMPENVAFQHLDVDEEDIFLALSWLAFDDPEDRPPRPPGTEPGEVPEGAGGAFCTERSLELGYNYWKTLRRPRASFYRCLRPPRSLAEIDTRAFDRVGLFYQRFDSPEKNRFAYHEIQDGESFEAELKDELGELASKGREVAKVAEAVEVTGAPPRAQLRGDTQFEKKMQPGKAYEVTFLSLAIHRWEDLDEDHDDGSMEKLSESFLELVKSTASNYGGEIFSWGPSGGLVIFWAKRSFDHAIMTGLKLLHNLPVFNLDPEQNPLGQSVEVRAAAHDAVIVFQLPIEDISSSDIHFVGSLQRDNTASGELCITRRLLERVDERLRPHFQFKGRWEREPIYSCRLPSSQGESQDVDLEDYVRRLKKQTSLVRGLLDGRSESLDAQAMDSLSSAFDETYSLLNKFCGAFASVNYDWTPDFLARLGETAGELRGAEADLWSRLRERLSDSGLSAGAVRRLDALAQGASRRRSRPVVLLEKLEVRCRSLAASGAEPELEKSEADEELLKDIDRLIKADDLDNETALTELLLHKKGPFLDYVKTHQGEKRHTALLDKMWETADLALLDDVFSIRGHKRASDELIFDALGHPQVKDERFRIVREFLEAGEEGGDAAAPDEAAIAARFEQTGLRATKPDHQVVWRCLVIGHEDEDVRTSAALRLNSHSMWQVVSHPNVPVTAIYAIGERMQKKEGEDAKKIFFDCTRARIEQVVENFRTREELDQITKLVMLLMNFSFLVETGYFERFDDILRKFLANAQSRGLKVDYFERLRKTLEAARQEAGDKGPARPPAGLKSLPLTIQRRLAGEARYIYWFVTHPDPRVAGETLRHIGLMHVERVLRLREINGTVLNTILRKHELFTRQQALVAALNHPKCTQEFATRYVPRMVRSRHGRQALDKIATNPSASPVVRSTAKRAMANAQKMQRR